MKRMSDEMTMVDDGSANNNKNNTVSLYALLDPFYAVHMLCVACLFGALME